MATILVGLLAVPANGQSVESDEETIRSGAEIALRVGESTAVGVPVDYVATVNFWDSKRKKLFVQNGLDAIYIRLPARDYENGIELAASLTLFELMRRESTS